jgi:hypothetical protein
MDLERRPRRGRGLIAPQTLDEHVPVDGVRCVH